MEVTLPNGKTIECEVEMDGYKVADIYDEEGISLIYDLGLTQDQVDKIYRQAELDYCDRMANHADGLRKLAKEGG